MAYEGLLDWAMTLHHAAGVLGMLAVLDSNNSGLQVPSSDDNMFN